MRKWPLNVLADPYVCQFDLPMVLFITFDWCADKRRMIIIWEETKRVNVRIIYSFDLTILIDAAHIFLVSLLRLLYHSTMTWSKIPDQHKSMCACVHECVLSLKGDKALTVEFLWNCLFQMKSWERSVFIEIDHKTCCKYGYLFVPWLANKSFFFLYYEPGCGP